MADLSTQLVHHPYSPPAEFEAVVPGIFKASTVIFPNVAAMRARDWRDKSAYTYGLHGTPTTFTLEERLCTLEGAKHAVLVPSGLSAIATVNMALLQAGDEVLIPDNAYSPAKALAENELKKWGITSVVYDPMASLESLSHMFNERTRLLWLEAPGSVTMEFPDLPALVTLAREKGVYTALDNTWGAGLAFNPFALAGAADAPWGVDVSIQALTKYASGGGDVLMGSIVSVDAEVHQRIQMCHMRLGLGVAANDAELVLRGLPSMKLRYEAQDKAARELATWLAAQPEVRQVLHPAFEGSPGHTHWQSLCTSAAGIFSVQLQEDIASAQVDAFCDALRLFKLGYSWGGPMSLVMPYDLPRLRAFHTPHQGGVVRFCIGLESVTDLQADLLNAMNSTWRQGASKGLS